jgi:mannan endo-1,4-beta-mannosidase
MHRNRIVHSSSACYRLIEAAVAVCLLLLVSRVRGAPADPDAWPEAGQILAYLESLPSREDTRVVSGQFLGYGFEYQSGYQQDIVGLHTATGAWVAMVGTDYAFSDGTAYTLTNGTLMDYWNAGGLVTIGYHIPDPGASNLAELIDNGSAYYATWISRLDWIAERLAHLRDNGVVVLWRPFHEMNGNWFWYGAANTADFVALWRHMFDYFTGTKGLHNLLWVYAPDDGPGNVTAYYPGDSHVDIVGLDNYNYNSATLDLTYYAAMTALGKPFGLTEFSPKGPGDTPDQGDYTVLVEGGLKERYPLITFFQCWNREWGMAYNLNADVVLDDPWVITRDELDWQSSAVADMAPMREKGRHAAPLGTQISRAAEMYGLSGRSVPRDRALAERVYFVRDQSTQRLRKLVLVR